MALPQLRDDEFRVDKIRVLCFRCGKSVEISVERGCKPPPKLCTICADIDPRGYAHGDMINPNYLRNVKPWGKHKGNPLPTMVYRPGHPDFNRLASLYTPPTQPAKRPPKPRPMDYLHDDFMNLELLPEDRGERMI